MATQQQNPKNEESPLYKALTRLFSGPIVNFKQQGQIRYRRGEMDKLGSKFNSLSGKAFKKVGQNPYDVINTKLLANQNRNERYLDFDQMEFTPEIASSMDIYADEMTTFNEFRQILNIESNSEEIKEILKMLFYDVLNVDSNLYTWCRTMCKYGDLFMYLEVDPEHGVKNVTALPTQEVERLEGEDKSNPNYIQYQWNAAGLTFENWQIAHFRILGQDKYAPYGTSVLEASRRVWRQLTLLEDAMMAYRIVRAPERRVFYIDVGAIPPPEYEQHIQRVMTSMKRNQVVDQNTGRVDLRYNPMSIEEDYYIPVKGQNSGTKIENLAGGSFTSAIEDVKYLREKLFSALKVPQSYLARGEGSTEDKATLSTKDIRFARTVQRLQRVMIAELVKIAQVHLYLLGYRSSDLVSFKLMLNNPSKIAELQELEHFKARVDAAGGAKDSGFSKHWIFKNIFKLSQDEFLTIQNELFYDKNFEKTLESAGEGVEGEDAGGSGGGGLGLGGGGIGGEGEAGGTGEAGGIGAAGGEGEAGGIPPPPEAGEESPLLAAPAKRDDLPPSWHGKDYEKVKNPKFSQSARTRHERAKSVPEIARNVHRNILPGHDEFKSMSRGIFNEQKQMNVEEERFLNEAQSVLNSLAAHMEKKNEPQ
jgi:hypothetical protein